jgi:hypothetical protein
MPVRGLAILGGLGLLAGQALAQATQPAPTAVTTGPPPVEKLIGVWELSSANGMTCRMQLRPDRLGDGYVVGTPPACKRAIPLLTALSRWSAGQDELILSATDGRDILRFGRPDRDGVRKAGVGGQDYALKPVNLRSAQTENGGSPAVRPAVIAVVRAPTEPAAGAPKGETVPGIYGAVRSSGPSGCRIRLLAAGPDALRRPASLEPGCADAGLIVFNPVAWRYEEGRLTLFAAKGHDVSLVFSADGSFRKDPPSGAELRLKAE